MVFGKVHASGKDWGSLRVGDKVEEIRTITGRDIFSYLGLTDDQNPLYIEDHYAAQTEYKKVIVPSGLLISWLSALASKSLPGPGSIVTGTRLSFPNVLHHGDTVRLSLELIHKTKEPQMITCKATVIHQDRPAAEGELDLLPPQPLYSLFKDAYDNF
ncbi:MaoC/PaaZ C-terminal domain-containing protein [Paenactinomyces guangxiensis]|uniref:MaoC family dehydratase N-terminal domain-containing protein n=1 Tax=Paenactinomyces guangxiensis TaxID=1490290 RepID=A0A7W1WT47_9BACL|nr:MaoC/PaaZ C-terminal domain-containing protein [Paenactinomyces guangxiensis]MBA4495508.1 MaoC family dehydratase N-terminal domain-containing protein [Paenactinomyces guangxiensis]MBH8592766.1 MaoC family dehydratase N-terminal domain-containing protein [Paenactinomyces guangxiensis]